MSNHLTDEDLILHFYGEGRREKEGLVNEHLASCPECQAQWREITSALKMADAAGVPEPDEGFEARMWARVQAALPSGVPDAEPRWRPSKRGLAAWWLPATGLAAAVLLAVLVGRTWRTVPDRTAAPPESPVPAATVADRAAGRERVLLTALDDHFQRSEMLLVEVMNGGSAAAELAFDRQTADDLVDSGRLYRLAAQQNGNMRLAAMLEELESVLVEIARSPEQMNRRDARALRARIDNDNLLFKVRAVSKQIEDRQRSLSTE